MKSLDTLAKPTVHLNGTSGEALFEQYTEALEALYALERAMEKTAPHGRDYYTQLGGPAQAIEEYRARMDALAGIRRELKTLQMSVREQMSMRERGRHG